MQSKTMERAAVKLSVTVGKIGRSKPRVWTEKKLPYEALSVLVFWCSL